MAVPRGEGEAPAASIEVRWQDLTATVCRNDGHPEEYLWIFVEGKRYFLGNLVRGMTRGDVRRLAHRWLAERCGSP